MDRDPFCSGCGRAGRAHEQTPSGLKIAPLGWKISAQRSDPAPTPRGRALKLWK
jgi:hypothetical protein